jgi:hypothetical protein
VPASAAAPEQAPARARHDEARSKLDSIISILNVNLPTSPELQAVAVFCLCTFTLHQVGAAAPSSDPLLHAPSLIVRLPLNRRRISRMSWGAK